MRVRRRVTFWRALGWGLTDVMGGGSGAIIGAYFLFFLTTFASLSALEAATIIGVARLIDMVANVVVGSVSDRLYRTRIGRRFGRRRFFLLLGIPLMLTFGLLWTTGGGFWYYFLVFVAFDLAQSIVMVPYETLPSEMTQDYRERTLMSTMRMLFSGLAGSVATLLTGALLAVMGQNDARAYGVMGAVFAVVFAIAVAITYLTSWEHEPTPEMLGELHADRRAARGRATDLAHTLWSEAKEYWSTLRLPIFARHLGIYLSGVTAQDVFSTVLMYYVVFSLALDPAFGSVLLGVGIVAVPLTPLWGYLFFRIGPARLYRLGFGMVIAVLIAYVALFAARLPPATTMVLAVGASVIYQAFKSIVYFVPWNVFPFIPDVDEALSGKRREGRFAGMMNFSRKATSSVATIAVGAVLTAIGFQPGATAQTPAVQWGIAITMLIGAGGLTLIALLLAARFPLTRHSHLVLVTEVDRLRAGGAAADVDPEVRRTVEQLTSRPYASVHRFDAPDPDSAAGG